MPRGLAAALAAASVASAAQVPVLSGNEWLEETADVNAEETNSIGQWPLRRWRSVSEQRGAYGTAPERLAQQASLTAETHEPPLSEAVREFWPTVQKAVEEDASLKDIIPSNIGGFVAQVLTRAPAEFERALRAYLVAAAIRETDKERLLGAVFAKHPELVDLLWEHVSKEINEVDDNEKFHEVAERVIEHVVWLSTRINTNPQQFWATLSRFMASNRDYAEIVPGFTDTIREGMISSQGKDDETGQQKVPEHKAEVYEPITLTIPSGHRGDLNREQQETDLDRQPEETPPRRFGGAGDLSRLSLRELEDWLNGPGLQEMLKETDSDGQPGEDAEHEENEMLEETDLDRQPEETPPRTSGGAGDLSSLSLRELEDWLNGPGLREMLKETDSDGQPGGSAEHDSYEMLEDPN